MTHLRLPYIQEWADREGRVHRYFGGLDLSGCHCLGSPAPPNSCALTKQRSTDHRSGSDRYSRTKPGSVSAAIAGYYSSLEFRSLATRTQGGANHSQSVFAGIWRQAD